jgi:hypothetical protein
LADDSDDYAVLKAAVAWLEERYNEEAVVLAELRARYDVENAIYKKSVANDEFYAA